MRIGPEGQQKSRNLHIAVAIPARFASTRLPGKPLAKIGGKTMIRRVYERAAGAKGVSEVLVATDDDRIAAEVTGFGGTAVLTSPDHPSGTDRLAEVFRNRPVDVVVNVQGDEPFLDPEIIEALIEPFFGDPQLRFATLKTPITNPQDLLDTTIAKLVVDHLDHVLYFSRAPIPFVRDAMDIENGTFIIGDLKGAGPFYKHIGLYAYRRDFLLEFAEMAPAPIEQYEKLEQLRALYYGVKIKAVTVEHDGFSVDTPEDLARANERINSMTQR